VNLPIPDDIREWLDKVEQAIGELVMLRRVIDSMKAEDAAFVHKHAQKVGEELGLLASQVLRS
jgi:hypothetical protein